VLSRGLSRFPAVLLGGLAIAASQWLQCTEDVRLVGRSSPSKPDAGSDSAPPPATGSAGAPAAPAELSAFSPPQIVSELSDPNADESEPTLTTDELEIYFRSDRLGRPQIFAASRQSSSDRWSIPSLVDELVSETGATYSPEISPDGGTLFFVSDRPGGLGSQDIYVTTRQKRGEPWSAPKNVTELNTGACEIDPGPLLDHDQMIVTRCNDIGHNHLWLTQRAGPGASWDPPESGPIDQLNTDEKEGDPVFAQDGLALYFATTRDTSPSGDNRADIWRAARASLKEGFGPPEPVVELNILAVDDQDPWVSNDEQHIVFTSARDRVPREIYEAWR